MAILVNCVQPLKAELPIVVTPSVSVTDARLVQFKKEFSAQDVTPSIVTSLKKPQL